VSKPLLLSIKLWMPSVEGSPSMEGKNVNYNGRYLLSGE